MSNILSVLLIEDDIDECYEIQNCFADAEDIEIIGITNNAYKALEMVQSFLPNIILLDLELHTGGGNGLLFLAELRKLTLPFIPYILITTNNVSHTTLDSARQLGADFILAKYETGYSAQYVLNFVKTMKPAILSHESVANEANTPLSQTVSKTNLMKRIQRELNLIGISPKAVGFQYLIEAIRITTEKPESNLSHTLAITFGKSSASIERAMQNAINRAWQTNSPEALLKYYTARIRSDRGVPTMMEFIYYYATKLSI